MSVLGEYLEPNNNKKDLQIWNNSAFDDGNDSESLSSYNQIKSPSWLTKKPVPVNLSSDSLESSFSSKENRSPVGVLKSSVLAHPLHQSKPLKNHPIKIGSLTPNVVENAEKTDEEIEIENEISRLFAKLESIRRERLEKNGNDDVKNKKKEAVTSRTKIQRRGFSLGPNEILSATNSKSRQLGTTPIQSTKDRRKSCFWKLDDIEEEKSGFSRVKNARQAVTTVGSKGVRKDESVLASIQPKKLFGDQSVPAKKPVKPGRVVPSRYNQATVVSSMKKRSLTDNVERKSRGGTESRVKKKWEIPSVIVIPKRLNLDDENENGNGNENEECGVVMPEMILPRIRVGRNLEESGRDSGPAKRVADLVGKKSYFEQEEQVCLKLSFEEK